MDAAELEEPLAESAGSWAEEVLFHGNGLSFEGVWQAASQVFGLLIPRADENALESAFAWEPARDAAPLDLAPRRPC